MADGSINGVKPVINLQEAAEFDTSKINLPKVDALPPLPKVGFKLSLFLLSIISVFLLFLILYMLFVKTDASAQITVPAQANIADSTFSKKLSIIKVLQEEKKASRDFVLQISQMVLLNLLLPILTAVLGYIFGSRSDSKTA
ncbi:hypothetical protein [Mucilaginibacter sp.]|uniref:hypothetical protein n=1 Tax=Mucilaginibacter sp. TaxID=1882438 RepID=UPI003AFFB527